MKSPIRFIVFAIAGWLSLARLTAGPAASLPALRPPGPSIPAVADPALKVSGVGSFSPGAGTARLTIENTSQQPIAIDQLFVGPLRIQANLSISPMSRITRDFVVLDGPRLMSTGTAALPVAFAPLGANQPRLVGTVNVRMEARMAAYEHQIHQLRVELGLLAVALLAMGMLLARQYSRKR